MWVGANFQSNGKVQFAVKINGKDCTLKPENGAGGSLFTGASKPFTVKLAYKTGGSADSSTLTADSGAISMTDGDDFTGSWEEGYWFKMTPSKEVTS